MSWDLSRIEPPWDRSRPGLHGFIADHLDENGSLRHNVPSLPDEVRDPNSISFAAGALDGISRHFGVAYGRDDVVTAVVGAVAKLARGSTSRAAERLYRLVTDTPTLEFIDKALPFIMSSGADPDRITAIGHWLATETPDRSAAKFGIALLGMMDPVDVATLQLLGTHDEFTLYAAVALRNSSAGDGALFVASSEGALSPPPSMSSPCDAGGWSSTGTRHTQWVGLDGVHRRVTRGPPEVIATPESTPSVRAGERQ